ncbi:MAG: glycosyltransferase family 4 protein [Candidatus Thermoplasmatota archaeon]|jgi:glycosyltransferase involved in cell wall biosynthesis|nr:glycosyltransferase family 4 protein [Candidatus Thermoplasmatota archaeon]
MNIVHFSWEFPPVIYGGLGTFVTEVSHRQAALGHNVTVFSLNRGNTLHLYEKLDGVEVYRPKTPDLSSVFYLCADHELRAWGQYFKFFADVLSYNVISASQVVNTIVKKEGKHFDIVDAHDWLGIMAGMVTKKELGLPLVFHVHSTEVGRSIGRGSHTIKDIEFEGGQTADCVITVSNAMSDELQKLGFPPNKIRVCWNGVDTKKYDPDRVNQDAKNQLRRKYGINDNDHMIFFIGRLVSVKGVDNLIKAMPNVLNDFPNSKLVILGVGDMENTIRGLINDYRLQEKVVLRNEFVSEEERILHYAAADVVVLPSLYEPFGIVCTEAMSMAKPVVVGARGTNGMREQITPDGEKKCGIHINPYEPNDIAWGIKTVLGSKDEARLMGENARERAVNNFSLDIVTNKTLEIYKELIR